MEFSVNICKNCFLLKDNCKCDNSDILNVPEGIAKIHTDKAAAQLTDILVGVDLNNFLKDYNLVCYENQFDVKKQNQILLLYASFLYDCFPYNEQLNSPEKHEEYKKTGKCKWLHWKPL